jgi:DNA-directed RNA polymerase subunit RPC12/RpoP
MTAGRQRQLFAALVSCETCGWSWREGEAAPQEHQNHAQKPARVVTRGSINGAPVTPVPLKKWRCSRCWSKFKSPRAELYPVCQACVDGERSLFGEGSMIPKDAHPIGNPRRLFAQGKRGAMRRDRAKRGKRRVL